MRPQRPNGPAQGRKSAFERAELPLGIRHLTHRVPSIAAADVVQTIPRLFLVLAQQVLQLFWRAPPHLLVVGLLQILNLALVLLAHVLRVDRQGVHHAALVILQPNLDCRGLQVICPTGLGHVGLALIDLQHQRSLVLGCPATDLFVQQRTHGVFLWTVTPEQAFMG